MDRASSFSLSSLFTGFTIACTLGVAGGLVGCVGGSGSQTGDIQLALVGAPNYALFDLPSQAKPQAASVASAVVTINEIDARVGGAWLPLVTTPQQVDLLKLDNKTINTLGIVKLPVGHIDELRLVLDQVGDYVVLKDGTKKPLEVPDNGIVEVEGKLDLDACTSGIVILDFDPKIKTEDESSRREYELKCEIRIKTDELKGSCGGADMAGKGDMAKGGGSSDMAGGACGNVVCPMGQICELQGGNPVCVNDPCNGVVCPVPGQVCVVQNNQPVCVAPGGSPDGGCHHH